MNKSFHTYFFKFHFGAPRKIAVTTTHHGPPRGLPQLALRQLTGALHRFTQAQGLAVGVGGFFGESKRVVFPNNKDNEGCNV